MRPVPPSSPGADRPACARSARACPTRGRARTCWARTWSTCRRCSSRSRTRSSRSSPTLCTPGGRWDCCTPRASWAARSPPPPAAGPGTCTTTGRAIVYASALWGAAIAAFGLAHDIWFALAMLAVAGAGDMVSGIFRQLMWNQTIPDEVRGRMAGTELLSYSLGPQLGQVRSSLVAQWTSLRFSIVSGGVGLRGWVRSSSRRHCRRCGATTSGPTRTQCARGRCDESRRRSTAPTTETRTESVRHETCTSRKVLTRSSPACPACMPDPAPGRRAPCLSPTGSTDSIAGGNGRERHTSPQDDRGCA